MIYKNSVALIRTRKGNVAGCHMVVTRRYIKLMPTSFCYKGCYICDNFEILENVGGDVVIISHDRLGYAGVDIKNRIRIQNVSDIEIMTEHEE